MPASTVIVPVFFMCRHGAMVMVSRPPILVSIIRRGSPMAPSRLSARAGRFRGSGQEVPAKRTIRPGGGAASGDGVERRPINAIGIRSGTDGSSSGHQQPAAVGERTGVEIEQGVVAGEEAFELVDHEAKKARSTRRGDAGDVRRQEHVGLIANWTASRNWL